MDVNAYVAQAEGWAKQADEEQAAQKAAEQAPPLSPHQQLLQMSSNAPPKVTPSYIDRLVSFADSAYQSPVGRAGRDIVSGAVKGAVNTGDAAVSFAKSAAKNFTDPQTTGNLAEVGDPAAQARERASEQAPSSPVWDHVRSTALDFRDAIAVQHPGTLDNVLESAAQMMPSYIGFGRLLSGIHDISLLGKAGGYVAHEAATGAASEATANDPHSIRIADALSLLRQTQGKFGQALRTAAPDGSGLNAFINYLGDHTNESEAEGRFKNAIEGAVINPVVGPLFSSVGSVLKQGWRGLRFAVENGVGSAGDLAPAAPATQRGAVGDVKSNVVPMPSQTLRSSPEATAAYINHLDNILRRDATGQLPPERRVTVQGNEARLPPDQERRFSELMKNPGMRQKFYELVTNNASGESSASQEAVNRVRAERDAGVTRWSVDPDGQLTPLTGVDAIDARAQKGHIHIIRDAEGHESVTDRGGLTQAQAKGLLARSKLMRLPEGVQRDNGPEK